MLPNMASPRESLLLNRPRDQRSEGQIFRPGRIPKWHVNLAIPSKFRSQPPQQRDEGHAKRAGHHPERQQVAQRQSQASPSFPSNSLEREGKVVYDMRGPSPLTFDRAMLCAVLKPSILHDTPGWYNHPTRPAGKSICGDGSHTARETRETSSQQERGGGGGGGGGWMTARDSRSKSGATLTLVGFQEPLPSWISLPTMVKQEVPKWIGNHLGYAQTLDVKSPRKARKAQLEAQLVLEKASVDQDVAGKFASQWDELDKQDEALMAVVRQRSMPIRPSYSQKELAVMKARQERDKWTKEAEVKKKRDERSRKTAFAVELARQKADALAREEEERLVWEEEERKRIVRRLSQQVFKALCSDPDTGEVIDPKTFFRKLDQDKSGTVDKDEFRMGLEMCRCSLSAEEVDVLWSQLDGDDGESDGEVDYVVLVNHLQRVNEEAIRGAKPPAMQLLQQHTDGSMQAVERRTRVMEMKNKKPGPVPLEFRGGGGHRRAGSIVDERGQLSMRGM